MPEIKLKCYRLTSRLSHYDEETIWAFVQRSGGHISIRGDCIDYWIPTRAEVMLICAWPDLERRPEFDLI
jgi:hypothetical protein